MIQTVIKRDGRKEPFNPQKCNDWIKWASKDIQEHVDWSSIVLKTIRTMPEEVTAKQLQDGMIRTCLDMNSYGYNKMAGRLYSQALKKEIYAWNNRKHPHIKDLHERMIATGVIVKPNYSDEEYDKINKMLKHDRDLTYAHYSLHLIVSKYALQDRVRKVVYETPQFAMMRVAMQAMNNYHEADRMKKLEELYAHISFQRLCVPTPYYTTSLTIKPNVASCCVIKADDTVDSLGVGAALAYMLTASGAGIGANINTRSIGSAVRGGAIQHTGKIPYMRLYAASVKSNKQGCYDDVTEILTSKGWKLGVELTDDDMVAQVNDDLQVSFVKPIRLVNYHYSGDMYRFSNNTYKSIDLLVTPDHDMPFKKVRHVVTDSAIEKAKQDGMQQLTKTQWVDAKFSEEKAETFAPSRLHALYNSGYSSYDSALFSPTDALSVAYQADGRSDKGRNFLRFWVKKQRKINQLIKIAEGNFDYDMKKLNSGHTEIKIYVNNPEFFTKDFSQYTFNDKSYNWLKSFVLELSNWDSIKHKFRDSFEYVNNNKAAIDAAQMAAALCGAATSIGTRLTSTNNINYRLSISFRKNHICSSCIKKDKVQYDGRVWCVEVPEGKVIVRRNGITAVNKNSRGGALTMYYPFTDPELFDLLILKNPLTVTAKRLRELDYGVIVNKWLFQRAAKKQDIYLFDSSQAPELYEAIYTDTPEEFEKKMTAFLEANPDKVKAAPALDVLKAIMKERMETGRVYLFFADEVNRHTPFKETIYSSNLCITGDQWVVTDKGMFTAKELHDLNENLVLFDGEKAVQSSPMRLRSISQPVMKITLSNGATHKVTYEHKIKTPNGMFMAMDLSVGEFVCTQYKEGLFGSKTMGEKDIEFWLNHNRHKGIPEELKQGTKETQENFVALLEKNAYTNDTKGIQDIEAFYHTVKANLGHYNEQYARIVSIEYVGTETVYCPTVDTEEHVFVCNGIITGNCSEIALVTKGYNSYEDLYNTESEGITAFCNLAGITLDKISSDEEYQDVAYYALLMIDEGINNADLGFPQLNKSIRDWRSAGVGVLGLAHLMAKNKLSYTSQEGKDFMHRLAERHSYALHKAAVRLTKERGLAPNIHRTKYPDGWMPIDTYNRNVDELTKEPLHFDWEALREEIKALGGLHFTVLDTIPPSETSSQACETSNAIYPIREGSIVKVSGDTTTNFVAPEYETLKDYYDIAWEVPTKDMISVYAIWQKFISQGISCDFWIDRSQNRDVSTKQLIQELFWCNKYGLKGNYYYNTKMDADVVAGAIANTTFEESEPAKEQQDEPGCGSGGCTL